MTPLVPRPARGGIIALFSLGLLGVMALMGHLVWSGYCEAIATAEITSRNYATFIESRLSATLRRADATLAELTRDLPVAALSKQSLPQYAATLDAGLDLRRLNFPELAGLRVFDEDGDLLYTTESPIIRRPNIADRAYFRRLRDTPQTGLAFEVTIGRVTGRPALAVARALRGARNEFHGIVLAAVDLDHFQALFRSLDIGPHGGIGIFRRDDFTPVVVWPPGRGVFDKPLPPDSAGRQIISSGRQLGTREATAALDGIVRIYSVHALDRYPFFVGIGLARWDALAGWQARVLAVGLAGFLLALLLATLVYRLWRAEARQSQAIADLIASEANLHALSDNASVGILVLLEGRYIFANREAARILGYTVAALEQTPIADTILPDTRALLFDRYHRRLAGENVPARYETQALAKDGRTIPIEINAAITSWNGQRASMVFFSDITARHQAEAERLALEDRLRQSQKLEAIGKLTGGLAHDFNNYLGVIIGNLDLLQEGAAPDSPTQPLIDGALSGALRSAELTRSLLAFARRQPLAPRPTDISQHLDAMAKLLKRTLGEDITLTMTSAPNLWRVRVDGAQLDSCLVNLANNARDAMSRGGTLTITARNTRLDAEAYPDAVPGDHVLLEISDTGTGMSPATMARVFEPFFTTKPPGNGTGLGLSMVYGFVTQSGGHVGIASEPGRGTIVRIHLPRDPDEVAATESAEAAAPAGGTETILVVEDNEPLRQTTIASLAALGYRAIGAENAASALALLNRREHDFDLLFTDIVMPGKCNGHDLARQARERWPRLRILLTSGFPGDTLLPATNLGLSLLQKPYRKHDLARAIRAALA